METRVGSVARRLSPWLALAATAELRDGPAVADQGALDAALTRYWRANIAIMAVLLTIWAAVGLGCGVLFADSLNAYSVGGFPLGFWFAQQGSIITFIVLILVYCVLLNRLDAKHKAERDAARGAQS